MGENWSLTVLRRKPFLVALLFLCIFTLVVNDRGFYFKKVSTAEFLESVALSKNNNNYHVKFLQDKDKTGDGGDKTSFGKSVVEENKLASSGDIKNTPQISRDDVESVWTYRCNENRGCFRDLRKEDEESIQIEICWLTCGPLWPYPTGNKTKLGNCLVQFQEGSITFIPTVMPSKKTEVMLQEMENVFLGQIRKMQPKRNHLDNVEKADSTNTLLIEISLSSKDTSLSLDTDESYFISIFSVASDQEIESSCNKTDDGPIDVLIQIKASTIFGARHALETLSQIIAYDSNKKCFQIVGNVNIEDNPEFPYRGVLLDTARNFIPVSDLKRMIDAMSYNKLNIFHWHLTDSNSFPFYSKSVPQMTKYGAYGPEKIYFPEDIQDLVKYALIRGIKIIPELDAPAHAGNGWQWGNIEGKALGDLALCVNAEPWRSYCGQPPCGHLNPININTLVVLEKIYKDMLESFDKDLFHMGGDEVYPECWISDPMIAKVIKDNATNFMGIWGDFQQEAYKRLKKANGFKKIRPIVWTSGMTSTGRKFLNPSDYIIQIWETGQTPLIQTLLDEKYQIIMSPLDSMYLDHGGGSWLGRDHIYQYKNWQLLYVNNLKYLEPPKDRGLKGSSKQILGGEVTMWSEKVNSQNMDAKIWPRSSALAENLWSSPQSKSPLVYSRLNHNNQRMISRGIRSDQLQPESCYQISGHCDDPKTTL